MDNSGSAILFASKSAGSGCRLRFLDLFSLLSADEYGFHQGNILWRGRFSATESDTYETLELEVASGWGGGFSVWLDSTFLGSAYSRGSDTDTLLKTFGISSAVLVGQEHVMTVLQGQFNGVC